MPADPFAGMPPDHPARRDCFRPPDEPVLCRCLHCLREYMSNLIEWRPELNPAPDRLPGFWCCPYEDCDGKGFEFDIFPLESEIWSDEPTEEEEDDEDPEALFDPSDESEFDFNADDPDDDQPPNPPDA